MDEKDQQHLEALVKLFEEHGLDELVVEEGSFKVNLRRNLPEDPAGPAASPPATGPAAVLPPRRKREGRGRTVAVRAPLIGVFYRATSADAPPFVEIGDVVKEGQTVCVVEAMKVFNEIKAEWDGRVVAIPAEDGKLVQAGDPLVVLEFSDGAGPKEGT